MKDRESDDLDKWAEETERRVVNEDKESKGKEGFESLGRMYGAFIKSFKQESGESGRVAADVLIAYIDAYSVKPK